MSTDHLSFVRGVLDESEFIVSSSINNERGSITAETRFGYVDFNLSEARVFASFDRSSVAGAWSELIAAGLSISKLLIDTSLYLYDKNQNLVSNPKSCTRMDLVSGLIRVDQRSELVAACDAVLSSVRMVMTDLAAHKLHVEGREITVTSKRYERSPAIRSKAIEVHGLDCSICGFNFQEMYGELGEKFIHIHHIERVADAGLRAVDIKQDVIAVCANCHAMLHREIPPLQPDELKGRLRRTN